MTDDLCFRPATELAGMLRAREISARELLDVHLDRIDRLNPSLNAVVTLDADGDSSAVFVFQIGAALSPAAGSKVLLTDGALANNVFWQVEGAVSLGAGAQYVGTFLAAGAITFGDGASIKGRALTPGAITVTNSPFTEPKDDLTAPIVTIDGGATRSTNDTTPSPALSTVLPLGAAKSRPEWKARPPVKGSVRLPKPELWRKLPAIGIWIGALSMVSLAAL